MNTGKTEVLGTTPERTPVISRAQARKRNAHFLIWCEICGTLMQQHQSKGNCSSGTFDGLRGDCRCVHEYEEGTDGEKLRRMMVMVRDAEQVSFALYHHAAEWSEEERQLEEVNVHLSAALRSINQAYEAVKERNKRAMKIEELAEAAEEEIRG